jgi:hypothetical protein
MSEENVGKRAIPSPVGKRAIPPPPPPPPPPYKSTQNSKSDAHQRTNAGTKED